ncbi:putative uncharacterized protein [Bacteroides sp. CAG:598]|nr:putative uncharacterized protein [Bacteroides sp. CAG:598]
MEKEELKIDGLGRKRGTVHAPWRIGFFMPHFLFFILFFFSSCHYSRPNLEDEGLSQQMRDSLTYLYERHYTWDTNLEVNTDSVQLELLPVKGAYYQLHRGDRVVVAEFAVHPADSIDSVWVKLAHSQEVQGWLREVDLKRAFVPTDSISQAIYVFSDTHASYFIVVFAIFVAVWLVRVFRRKQLQLVYFNDIDSLYPLALCLLMAFCATVYESIQVFAPDTWEHYYYNPTLSPFKVPFVLSMFLVGLWLFLVVLLAVLDDLFRQLSPAAAVFYLLGLASSCIFCYFFFILTTHIYVGYVFLAAFIWIFIGRLKHSLHSPRYRCGRCGGKLMHKGVCPHCGAVNE